MKSILIILASILPTVALAAAPVEPEWVYKMENTPSGTRYIEDKFGNVSEIMTGTELNNKRKITMEVTLKTHDYFTEENVGHIVLLLGGVIMPNGHTSGHGVIIGNVTGYDKGDGVCKGNPRINSVSVETFWDHGNCVYPNDIGITFRDGVIYHIATTIDNYDKTVTVKVEDEYGWNSEIVVPTTYNDIAVIGNTWGFTEVMGSHSWVMYLTEPDVYTHW